MLLVAPSDVQAPKVKDINVYISLSSINLMRLNWSFCELETSSTLLIISFFKKSKKGRGFLIAQMKQWNELADLSSCMPRLDFEEL